MSKKLIYTITGIICLTLSVVKLLPKGKTQKTVEPVQKEIVVTKKFKKVTTVASNHSALKAVEVATAQKQAERERKHKSEKVALKSGVVRNLAVTKVSFDELPGWDTTDVKKSLSAFQISCENFLKHKPSHPIGSQHIRLKAGDWHPACKAALDLKSATDESARAFFEQWFHPIEFGKRKPVHGTFTGYYMPQLDGRLTQSAHYNTPIYGMPKRGYSTSFTRAQIDNGALNKKAPVIAWIHSPVERLFMEIEGAGVIKLPDGKSLYLSYAGENGAPYTSIGKVLINKGIMNRHNASKKAIIRYLENHPSTAKSILHKNRSFVYFEDMKKPMAVGAQDIALTPGYSLAVDKKWIPLGAPLWLDTKRPAIKQDAEKHLQRLMIAQDTGGAIRGIVRGDIYWGSGKAATFLGEHMKNKGHYWLLLPKHIFHRLSKK